MSKKATTGDAETDEILAEMEAEGLELPEFAKGGGFADSQDDSDMESEEAEEDADSEDEESKDEEESDDDDSEDEDEEDDDGEEEDDEDEDDEEEEGVADGKRLSLVDKYRREKKLRRDAEAALEAAKSGSTEDFEREVKEFAEKNRMNLDTARGLINLAAKAAGVPKDVMADIEAVRKDRRERSYWQGQRRSFDRDFRGNVIPLLRANGASNVEIRKVYDTMNGATGADGQPAATGNDRYWAWSTANKGKSLVELALEIRSATGNRISSEGGSRGRARVAPQKDPSEMTGADIDEMTDEEFDKFSDGLAKSQKSVIRRV